MSLYRIYIDEVGNHDLTHADDPNQRYLSLTGVILESQYTLNILQPEMTLIKREFFQHDPDEQIIFHRKELVNKKPPFHSLRDSNTEQRFNDVLLGALARWDYHVITVAIDKKTHRDQYLTWRYHPYHYCIEALLERFVLFLHYHGCRGDVMIEKRGGKEDEKLNKSYARLFENGTDYITSERMQECLTSKELKMRDKSANITGLQLADLIAHPSRRDVLIEYGLLVDNRDIFGNRISKILRQSKYLRDNKTGKITGFGMKLLP